VGGKILTDWQSRRLQGESELDLLGCCMLQCRKRHSYRYACGCSGCGYCVVRLQSVYNFEASSRAVSYSVMVWRQRGARGEEL